MGYEKSKMQTLGVQVKMKGARSGRSREQVSSQITFIERLDQRLDWFSDNNGIQPSGQL